MAELPLGVSTWTFNGLLPEEYRAVVDGRADGSAVFEQGIDAYFVEMVSAILHSNIKAVELWYSRVLHTDLVLEQLDRLKSGHRIVSMHAPFGERLDLSSPDAQVQVSAVNACMQAARLLARVEGRTLVVHGSPVIQYPTERPVRMKQCAASVQEIADRCADLDLSVAVELLPGTCLGNSAPELLSLLESIDRPNVGVCVDTNHVAPFPLLLDSIRQLGSHIRTLHISDCDGEVERHWLPPLGIIDWAQVIELLSQLDYQGPFLYEVHFDAADITDAVRVLEENYQSVMKHAESRTC